MSENGLISTIQSSFRPGDSTVNLLFSITHNIYQVFENRHKTRAVFLDISKAFDRVWHDGLLLILKSNEIDGLLYSLTNYFLSERFQHIVLNGKTSSWERISAGAPLGPVLGPLFFLIYINDLAENVVSQIKLIANDTSIFQVVSDINVSWQTLSKDLNTIQHWAFCWKMSFNPDPAKQAKEVIFLSEDKSFSPSSNFQ